jgi:hypothetical protein
LARRKKKELPKIDHMVGPLLEEFRIRLFPIQEIPEAVVWAERGNIAIHENYHSRRRQSYHVICGVKERLEEFCRRIGVPEEAITASEFFRFWHLTWFPHLTDPEAITKAGQKAKKGAATRSGSVASGTGGNGSAKGSSRGGKKAAVAAGSDQGSRSRGCTIHRIRP